MTFSLYAATIPSYLQILAATEVLVVKAGEHCAAGGLDPDEILSAKLADDMFGFAYQVKSAAVHSFGAIEGVRKGEFNPDTAPPPADFAELRARLAAAVAGLMAIEPSEVDGFVGKPMAFVSGTYQLKFVAEEFLMSFSQPNFYFHATTAYAILRSKGLAVGKRDYLGRPRLIA